MPNTFVVKNKIKKFNKTISVNGDKSISIRWLLFSSLASGISTATNLLVSEDVLATINSIRKLGIKIVLKKKYCKVFGKGMNGYKYKENLTINAKNSGTLARLLLGLFANTNKKIKLIGDKSLSQRDFKRVIDPLKKFGVVFDLNKKKTLPLKIIGPEILRPINYFENKGSAQCKSCVIFAGMRTKGRTLIKAKKSRNHTEILCKFLKLPIKIKTQKNFDLIEVNEVKNIKPLNYKIPSDISSAAFFITLTALSKNSKIIIRKVNINHSRDGVIRILKKMGIKIFLKNKKIYKGEKIADILVKGSRHIKSINCPTRLNSNAIDEFLLIFLVAAKAKGVSNFRNIGELNQKESKRLDWGAKILNKMGVRTIQTQNSIKIFGNPNLEVKKKIVIKDYLKDHRVFMTSVVAALSFGGKWYIHDKDSINTSFPSFLKILDRFTLQ